MSRESLKPFDDDRGFELATISVDANSHASLSDNFFDSKGQNEYKVFTKEFRNISNVFDFINSENFSHQLKTTEKMLMIQLKTDENFDNVDSIKLNEISTVCQIKSIIVIIISRSCESFSLFWKSSEIDYFLAFEAPKGVSGIEMKEVYGFLMNFLMDSLCKGYLGVKMDCELPKDSNLINLNQFADPHGFDLFKLCAESGNVKCVEILLNLNLFNDNPYDILNAQSRAQHNKHFDVLTLLIKNNFAYPMYMPVNEYPEELKSFIEICEEVHDAVLSKNIERIAAIINQNPNIRHFYNRANKSALKVAIDRKFFNIYELLLSNDVILGPHEQFSEIFNNLTESEKTTLREIHFKYSKDLPENHMNVLMMNTQISHDDTEKEGKEKLVLRAYSVLNKNPLINPILKVVAASKHFGIIFDFKRSCVDILDPTAEPDTRGLFYTKGMICIGAKQLLNPATENETYGTLAHELCHYAMNLTYKNQAKPFFKDDRVNIEKFENILENCKKYCEVEKIVGIVFDYQEQFHSAELIVRVVHLLALYHDQPEKLKELEKVFASLFEYHKDVVVPDMEKALPEIKRKADKKMKEKDSKISKLRLFLLLSIGLGIIVACLASWYFYKPTYKFDELSIENQEHVKNSLVWYKSVDVKLNELFPVNSSAFNELTSVHIEKLLEDEILDFSDPQLYYLDKLVIFKWHNLTDKLKDKFLNSYLNFQGEVVKIADLNTSCQESYKFLTSRQIISTLSEDKFNVGQEPKSIIDFYLNRSFIPEETKTICFEFEFGFEYVDNFTTREDHKKNRTAGTTFENHYINFSKLSFEDQSQILKKVKDNKLYKDYYYDLNSEAFEFLKKDSFEIIEQALNERFLILSSEAGAGKTVTFEQLSIQIKKKFPTRWVSYIDLKAYTEYYKVSGSQNHQNISTSMTQDDIVKLLKNILKLSPENDKFEAKIFEESFKSGTTVLIWNGFDEISPTYNEFIFNVLKTIHDESKNIQLVCTRPFYSDQLSRAFKISSWQLVPFNESTRIKFLRQFFTVQNVTTDQMELKIEKINEIIKKFNFTRGSLFYHFQTPLMMRLFAEIHEDQKLLESGNIYGIYDVFITRKIQIWLDRLNSTKSSSKYVLLGGEIKIMFRKYALLGSFYLFMSLPLGLKMKTLQIMQKDIPEEITAEEMSNIGILYINEKNNFEFAHKTFIEFFVAQYFIENIYNIDGDVNPYEAKLRLEIFFYICKTYGYGQEIVTDFMMSYLHMKEIKPKNFHPAISKPLRNKFNNFFFRLLDINHPKIFEFVFEFFKKDHKLLVDLLHVHKDETLYTAVFNPNHFGLFVDPDEIKNLAQKCLTDEEFGKFLVGKNQKGKVLFGMQFYDLLGIDKKYSKILEIDGNSFKNLSYFDSFKKISVKATKDERKELLKIALSPKIFYYFNDKLTLYSFNQYKALWTNFGTLLSKDEQQDLLGTLIMQHIESFPISKANNEAILSLLLQKVETFLSPFQIYEMFLQKNILHEVHYDIKCYKSLWNLLERNTNESQRRTILLKDDKDDKNFYFYAETSTIKHKYVNHRYVDYCYDFTPFKIFHRSILVEFEPAFEFTKQIYNQYFNATEIQDIILNSDEFMYYAVGKAMPNLFGNFTIYIEKIFNGNEHKIKNYLQRKINRTDFTVFEMIQDFKDFRYNRQIWFYNINLLSQLLDQIERI